MSTTGEIPIAHIVATRWEMQRLLVDRPACWQWAAFVSVAYQRMAAINARREATADEPRTFLTSDREVALFVRMHLRDCDELIRDCDRFMRAPEFMGVFGSADGEDTADAEGILRVAHRLMDFYACQLELAEECRDCLVPDEHDELLRDCLELLLGPVRDFGAFMKGVLARFDEMQRRAFAGDEIIVLRPVLLRTTTDEALMWSILDRLNEIT